MSKQEKDKATAEEQLEIQVDGKNKPPAPPTVTQTSEASPPDPRPFRLRFRVGGEMIYVEFTPPSREGLKSLSGDEYATVADNFGKLVASQMKLYHKELTGLSK